LRTIVALVRGDQQLSVNGATVERLPSNGNLGTFRNLRATAMHRVAA
jgi:hypothetical protein